MTTTNTYEIELKDLETVSGGTVGEFEDIARCLQKDNTFLEAASCLFGHIPGTNHAMAVFVEDYLENELGIKADFSLGFAGTGIGSEENTYIDIATGRPMSHDEVLDRIWNS
jgi:hypothetical protein